MRNEYNFDACLAFRHKPQRLWNVINTTTGRVLPQQPVPTPAETSNSYFHHFVHDIGATYDIPFGPHQPGDLDKIREVTQETVVKLLRNLDPSKAPGPDGMLPSVLRECSQFLAPSLAKVFNCSLQSGRVPDAWKMANITPLFKARKDDRFSPASYRGISLNAALSKTLERVVKEQLVEQLELKQVLDDRHFGFRNRRSTSQLLAVTANDWLLTRPGTDNSSCVH